MDSSIESVRERFRDDLVALGRYRRAADYLCAALIYLQDNYFLERELRDSDLRDDPSGDWGPVPGLNALFGHAHVLGRARNATWRIETRLWGAGAAQAVYEWLRGSEGVWPQTHQGFADTAHAFHCGGPWLEPLASPSMRLFMGQELSSLDAASLPILLEHADQTADEPQVPHASTAGYSVEMVGVGVQFEARLLGALERAWERKVQGQTPAPLVVLRLPRNLGVPAPLQTAGGLPAMDAATNPATREHLDAWLRSYHIEKILHPDGRPSSDIAELLR
jgi:hypothetical protein